MGRLLNNEFLTPKPYASLHLLCQSMTNDVVVTVINLLYCKKYITTKTCLPKFAAFSEESSGILVTDRPWGGNKDLLRIPHAFVAARGPSVTRLVRV